MKKLVVPETPDYQRLKSLVLGEFFPWYRTQNKLDSFYFHSHTFLQRPEVFGFPVKECQHLELFQVVFTQICQHNEDIGFNYLLRMNANSIEAHPSHPKISEVHEDHPFPHKNVIIYLTDAGGATIAGDDYSDPVEDTACLFEGPHCHVMPEEGRRVVLVVTYA
tara:strand:- start:463 stop:954 length:492 start_codon:yes stop_codon:yes gene_type:complete